jgi:hypothetical protein
MADDTLLREFAHTLAAKVALAKADHDTPEDALFAIGEIVHAAKRDPLGWLAANRYEARTQPARPEPAMPNAADIYRERARQVGGGR